MVSSFLASPYPPERSHAKPHERGGKQEREKQATGTRRQTGVKLPIFAKSSNGADDSDRQKSEASYFQEKLMENPAEGADRGRETFDHGRPGATALQLLPGHAHNDAEFPANFGHDHSVDFSSGRAYNNGG